MDGGAGKLASLILFLGLKIMLPLLISLLVLCLIGTIVYYIIGLLPLHAPIKNIVLIIFGVIIIVYLLQLLLGGTGYIGTYHSGLL